MPRISAFYGIVITMYFSDHPPAHFHAEYAGYRVQVAIETMEIIRGWLPPRAARLVTEWGTLHKDELAANWGSARAQEAPLSAIDPLP